MRSLVLILCVFIVAHAQPGKRPSNDLTGTEWRLVSIGPTGSETGLVAGTTVTLTLGEDGRASGSTGCNSYNGTFQIRGLGIKFSRLISTKRACLDQNANQQERRFLAALESADGYLHTSSRLTIRFDGGRMALNFTNNASSEADNDPLDDRRDPIATLSSYYNAINLGDYRRAYGYWESSPVTFEKFARGFADTDRVRLLVEPPGRTEGAAGSSFAEISAVVIATTQGGNERVFAGCYTLRRSNVRDMGWKIYRADISLVPSTGRLSRLLAQGCRNSQ